MEDLQLGIDLAITGMLVVFFALAAIATAIALLPKVIKSLEVVIGPEKAHHSVVAAAAEGSGSGDDVLIAIAIGAVLVAELKEDE